MVVARFPIDGVLAPNRITSSSSALHGYVIEISSASVVDLAVLGCLVEFQVTAAPCCHATCGFHIAHAAGKVFFQIYPETPSVSTVRDRQGILVVPCPGFLSDVGEVSYSRPWIEDGSDTDRV